MATQTYYLDKRILVSGEATLQKFDNPLNLKTYIAEVSVPYTLPNTIEVDTINESTLNHGVVVETVTLKDGKIIPYHDNAITQTTSITTAVSTGAPCGTILTVSSTVAAGASAVFTVNCAHVVTGSVILTSINNPVSAGLPYVTIQNIVNGVSFDIKLHNIHPTDAFNNVMGISFLIV